MDKLVGNEVAVKLFSAVEKGDLEAVTQILKFATADDVNHRASHEVC